MLLFSMFASILLVVGKESSNSIISTSQLLNSLMFWKTDGFSLFLNNLLLALLIFIIGLIIIKITLKIIKTFLKKSKNISDLLSDYLLKLISIATWIILIISVLSQLGVDMAPLIAGLGITSIILGFALRDSLSNFFAGSMIIINQPFRKGDFIQLGDLSGNVKEMDLSSVKLSSSDGKNITISNNLVWSTPITNFTDMENRRVDINVGVPYDCNIRVAKEVFKNLISSYPEVLESPTPIIEVVELANSSINFTIRAWVKTADYWKVLYKFNGEITTKLAEKDIFLPFPQFDFHINRNT